ncbi:MAG: hypothetical protein COU69_02795 [Candidatus Pacebacteria bacterium CG10_big_fil_rev_8_21_14_0_10_56_10]|nr:MAG: hypothetical protein COU69_02795 [Candidatus Pacebacteria bacterium CG10_big_fil_rev_8_21_14_0_10_56_10]
MGSISAVMDAIFDTVLPDSAARLIATFQQSSLSFLSSFYLSGGTALAPPVIRVSLPSTQTAGRLERSFAKFGRGHSRHQTPNDQYEAARKILSIFTSYLIRYSLSELFELVDEKYSSANYSKSHLLKSLVYFDDAQGQPMPRMRKPVQWSSVKEGVTAAARSFRFGEGAAGWRWGVAFSFVMFVQGTRQIILGFFFG